MKNIAKIGVAACAFFTLFQAAALEKHNSVQFRSPYPNETIIVAANGEQDLEKALQRNRAERARLEQQRRNQERQKAERARKRTAGKQYKAQNCREVRREKNGEIILKCTPRKKKRRSHA